MARRHKIGILAAVFAFHGLQLLIAHPARAQWAKGTTLAYRGSLKPVEEVTVKEGEKTFDLTYYVGDAADGTTPLTWVVDEQGNGEFPWICRVGVLRLSTAGEHAPEACPALLYKHSNGRSVVPIIPPRISPPGELKPDLSWEADTLQFQAIEQVEIDGKQTWQVVVHNRFGKKRDVWLDAENFQIVKMEERVFMNQGTPYTLSLSHVANRVLAEEELADVTGQCQSLITLRERLGFAPRSEELAFDDEQRKVLSEALPKLETDLASGPLARAIRAAGADLRLHSNRATAIEELVKEKVGTEVEAFALDVLDGGTLDSTSLAGSVTILHFWEYKNEPLEEPYGQVGYLEYLLEHRKSDGIKIYGIAVNRELEDDGTRRKVLSDIRKLKSFMNLTYPIALDSGSTLKAMGDPRVSGARLPLFVVVGKDGKISHYHVGIYEVDKVAGLKALDDAVSAALK